MNFLPHVAQAKRFYANALGNADTLAGLARFGITQEQLEAAQASLDEVEVASAAKQREMGEAQKATQTRDAAVDALEDWMSDFIAIARIAFEEDAQQLEKLGIVVRS